MAPKSMLSTRLSYKLLEESKKFENSTICQENLVVQLNKWVLNWDNRVFCYKIPLTNRQCYFYRQDQYHIINKLVQDYHKTGNEQIGQDRFAWTIFSMAIIKVHREQTRILRHGKCYLNKCLFILLLISFYLKMPHSELVCEILKEIITCTGNLRFMFSYLPSMSINMYATLLWTNPPLYEDELCRKFFCSIKEETSSQSTEYKDFFKLSQPFLLYIVQNLTPLHSSPYSSVPWTLHEIISQPILPEHKFSCLILAIQYNDKVLAKILLQLGAPAHRLYWDERSESYVCAERLMITSINSIMGSRQFLTGINEKYKAVAEYMDRLANDISSYAPYMRRSVFYSQLRKATNFCNGEESIYELNREIADQWGIGCVRQFPSLQQMCKINIRQQILKADKKILPSAVKMLPLPSKLIRYLNLELD